MDTRKVSATLGFTLLIGCVIGIVILIHNSGTSRRPAIPSPPGMGEHPITWNARNGFVNDPNYHSSQPTMQQVNELADELQRLLSVKSKPAPKVGVQGVASSPSNGSRGAGERYNGTSQKSATSPVTKASITAINYSIVSATPPKASGQLSNYTSPPSPSSSQSSLVLQNRNGKEPQGRVEMEGKPRGGGLPTRIPPSNLHPSERTHGKLTTEGAIRPGISRESGGGSRNNLYMTPWHPSILPPGIPPPPNMPTHHHHLQQQPYHFLHQPNLRGNPSQTMGIRPHPRRPQWEDDFEEILSSDEDLDLESIDDEDDDIEEREDPQQKNLTAELDTLLDLANHLYTSGSNGSAFQGFLKVINETIERGNNSHLLVELNEMYGKGNNKVNSSELPPTFSALKSQLMKKRNPYETSLTAFVFMSFGIFLLNQIHSFVEKGSPSQDTFNNSLASGRSLPDLEWFQLPQAPVILSKEDSSLDVLFQAPTAQVKEDRENLTKKNIPLSPSLVNSTGGANILENTTYQEGSSGSPEISRLSSAQIISESKMEESMEEINLQSSSRSMKDNSFSSGHVNNMFRAFLNILNAYTKDGKAMECIWSLYCEDLDKTAGKHGLYGVAARINSVGLRLIMNQIPTSLTMDVILRSLVGWDGLPCRKMLPECAVQNGTISPLLEAPLTNSV